MAFTKFASLENTVVLGIKGSQEKARTASLDKFADFEDYRTEDGYLYARIRAISSRVNKNHDGWPSIELAGGTDAFNRVAGIKTANFVFEADSKADYGYSTFLGKPIFVDHHNSDPTRARGVIVDSKLHVENHKTAALSDAYYSSAPDNHMPPTWVELLLEVDAKSFPKLAKAIIEGSQDSSKGIDGFSMGCDVERSVCSHCANVATTPDQYCEHVQMKGAEFPYKDPKSGKTSSRKSYEDCYGIKFFEISAVFDPADETALLREVRAHVAAEPKTSAWEETPNDRQPYSPGLGFERLDENGEQLPGGDIACPDCQGQGCENCHGTGQMNTYAAQPNGEGGVAPQRIGPNTPGMVAPLIKPMGQGTNIPRRQGSAGDPVPGQCDYCGSPLVESQSGVPACEAGCTYGMDAHSRGESPTQHTAEAPPPQVDELKVPEPVDTLREESVCPVCGSDMDEETCDVCGYTRPPDGFDNPDLSKANPQGDGQEPPSEHDDQFGGPKEDEAGGTSNNPTTAHVTNDMSWQVSTPHTSYTNPATEVPVVPNAAPATDEPKNATVKKDHSQPVTSNVRTAEDFLAAADAQRRTMSTRTADAASGAPEAATPDKNVDVDAAGGVMEATNEDASKADAQIDVTGEGTTGTSDVAADKTESVDQGDEHSKNIEEIHTKTWDNGSGVEKQRDPVGGGAYPSSGGVTSAWQVTALDSEPFPADDGGLAGGPAVKGTEPADPVGKADDRVDVQQAVTSPSNNSGETKTWSGTDGNGVTTQQSPVTNESLEGEDIVNLSPSTSSTHIFAAMKLADHEVALGLTPATEKYERAAELEKLSPEELQAEARVISRVKTAGLSKGSATKTAKRMPALGRNASVEKESAEENTEQYVSDASIFLK